MKAGGIIDCIFLIAVTALFYYGYNRFREKEEHANERVIEVNFWNPSMNLLFGSSRILPFDSSTGTFNKFHLNGIEKSDSLKLIEIKEALTDFNAKWETGSGVHVIFGDSAKYGDFIKVLDFCAKENIRRYAPYKNNIWIPARENLAK